ncbi:helix-turn-helix transcriptional regulator [Phormidium sp. LEGE 05292]|uniref:helix-turn-helix domain-containing protein n=1 Tax=[Phormidium] sp. LEGE 05292 TaxID=767427 RepID=UPI001880E270|nr:helix-turn-helix transcriptional regulator [Phormidium sp. LEGE 05292]MBE9225512.1 helix-turn-helix transcriptional regulator [Phormidium sp. LEGE 05292]
MTKKDELSIKQRFGLAIKQRRGELGISQEELAFRSGLHRTYISDIERGTRNPSLENIEKLAKALEISISTLFANYGIE